MLLSDLKFSMQDKKKFAMFEPPFSFYLCKNEFLSKKVFANKKILSLLTFSERACPLVKPVCCIYAMNGVRMGFHALTDGQNCPYKLITKNTLKRYLDTKA